LHNGHLRVSTSLSKKKERKKERKKKKNVFSELWANKNGHLRLVALPPSTLKKESCAHIQPKKENLRVAFQQRPQNTCAHKQTFKKLIVEYHAYQRGPLPSKIA